VQYEISARNTSNTMQEGNRAAFNEEAELEYE
jgi:hypothetical protein